LDCYEEVAIGTPCLDMRRRQREPHSLHGIGATTFHEAGELIREESRDVWSTDKSKVWSTRILRDSAELSTLDGSLSVSKALDVWSESESAFSAESSDADADDEAPEVKAVDLHWDSFGDLVCCRGRATSCEREDSDWDMPLVSISAPWPELDGEDSEWDGADIAVGDRTKELSDLDWDSCGDLVPRSNQGGLRSVQRQFGRRLCSSHPSEFNLVPHEANFLFDQ
jgi:hypothetical protein